jgi:hypothetical protein
MLLSSLGFIPRYSEDEVLNYQTVYSKGGATIGQVIGDAAEIVFTRGRLNSLYICVTPDERIQVLPQYTVPDLGVRTGESSAAALRMDLVIDSSGAYCVDVDIGGSSRITVMPIMTLADADVCVCCHCPFVGSPRKLTRLSRFCRTHRRATSPPASERSCGCWPRSTWSPRSW